MSEDHTMWSKTLLDSFIGGMKRNPSDAWVKEQARELTQRGMSVKYLAGLLRKDAGDAAADRFLSVVGGGSAAGGRKARQKKQGLLGRLLSRLLSK